MARLDRAAVEALLSTEQFRSWYAELSGLAGRKLMLEKRVAETEYEAADLRFRTSFWQDQADAVLLRSSDLRNTRDNLAAEVAGLENSAFRALAAYELSRERLTGLWEKITAIEHRIDDCAEESSRERTRTRFARELAKLRKEYHAEGERRDLHWEAEEATWSAVAERTLSIPEIELKADRLERHYETLSARSIEFEERLKDLQEGLGAGVAEVGLLDEHLVGLRAAAADRFSCLCHEDFLYWPANDDSRQVLMVPLGDNAVDFNIEMRACRLYRCTTDQGLSYIVPIGEPVADDDLLRLEEFFGAER
jgi:chromosome segregation ATPase